MEMIQDLYQIALVAFVTLLLFLGLYLIFGRCPEVLSHSSYAESRRIAGASYLWLALEILIFVIFDIRDDNVALSSVLNLIVYYFMALLLTVGFIRLIDEQATMSKSKVIKEVGFWLLYSGALTISYFLFAEGVVMMVVLIVGASIFLAKTILLLIRCLSVYKKAVERARNYHSVNIESIISWMPTFAYMFFALAVASAVASFASKGLVAIIVLISIVSVIYLFVNYINMMVEFALIAEQNGFNDDIGLIPQEENISEGADILKPDVALMIKEKIAQWSEDKGYTHPGVSIKTLSAISGTNRTYLSYYINSVYGMTFRDWIMSLRIVYAKQVLLDQPRLTIGMVAQKAGFSSSVTLTRAFTRIENISPVKWREREMELLKNKGIPHPPTSSPEKNDESKNEATRQ